MSTQWVDRKNMQKKCFFDIPPDLVQYNSSIFQDSEETIHSKEKNIHISHVKAKVVFIGKKQKQKFYNRSNTNALRINQFYKQFTKKYWELAELENYLFFVGHFEFFFLSENNLGFHMRYHFFLHYGWFLQNLGKGFIRTNMHMTVATEFLSFKSYYVLTYS